MKKPAKYLVWIEIETIDEDGDHVDSDGPMFPHSASFDTGEAAGAFAETLHGFAGLLALPEAVQRLKAFHGPGGTDAEDNVKLRLEQIADFPHA